MTLLDNRVIIFVIAYSLDRVKIGGVLLRARINSHVGGPCLDPEPEVG